MHLDWACISPSADFTNAATSFLIDDPASWPPSFVISGFTYDRFGRTDHHPTAPAWDYAARCAWLARQQSYDAGPYEHAARVFRQHGHTDGAKAILIAPRRQARRAITGRWAIPRRAVDAAYSTTVGYGYRPARVLWMLLGLITVLAVTLLIPAAQATMRAASPAGITYTTRGLAPPAPGGLGRQHTDSCGNGQVLCFSPLLYATDTVVPLISLGQRNTWYPTALNFPEF